MNLKIGLSCLILIAAGLALSACDDDSKKKEGCGNGLLDLGEVCDGNAVAAPSCAELGYYEQTAPIQCGAECDWDVSGCAGRCGDGAIDVQHGETCEGDDLGGNTCQSLGLGTGSLTCKATCRYELSACELAAVCGDGILAPSEECDDGNEENGDGCENDCTLTPDR